MIAEPKRVSESVCGAEVSRGRSAGSGRSPVDRIGEIAVRIVGGAWAWIVRKDGATLRCVGFHGEPPDAVGLRSSPLINIFGVPEGTVVEDVSKDARLRTCPLFQGRGDVGLVLGLPVPSADPAGEAVLLVGSRLPGSPDPEAWHALGLLAETLGDVLEGPPVGRKPEASPMVDSERLALYLSEQRMSSLFRNSPAAIGVSTVQEGRIIDVNERYCELLGYERDELLGRTVGALRLHVETHNREEVMNRLLVERRVNGVETRFRRKDGVLRDVIVNLELLALAGDSAPVMVAQIVDITERKQAEERIRQSRSMLRMASRVGRLGAWQVDIPDLGITCSDEAGSILGLPPGPPLGLWESFSFGPPVRQREFRKAFESCARDGTPFDMELRVERDGLTGTWIRLMGEAVRESDGGIVRVQGAIQDITQRRRDEEQLRLLEHCVSRLSDIVLITDAEPIDDPGPRIVYVNDAFERRTGYRREEVLGKTPRILQGPGTQRDALDRIRAALTEWKPVREELINYTKSGEEFWLELDIVPVSDSDGIFTHWIAIERDITERKRAESRLRMSEERFRLLAKASSDVIWDWDIARGEVWRSEGFELLSGVPSSGTETTVDRWTNLIHPDDRDRATQGLWDAVAGTTGEWCENYRIVRQDGAVIHVHDRGLILRDADGRAVRVVGGMMDITDRKRSEERIAEQAALIEESRDAIVVRDLEGRVRFWNRGAERVHGWSSAEACGRDLRDLVRFDESMLHLAESSVRRDGEWNGEIDVVSRSGVPVKLDSRWTLLHDPEGQPRSILTMDTDVTDRKKLEEQFLRAQRMDSIGTLAGGIAHDLNNVLAPILMSIELLRLDLEHGERSEILDTIHASAKRGSDMVKQVLSFARGVEGERVVVQVSHLVRDTAKIVADTFPRSITVSTTLEPGLSLILGDPTQIHQILLNLCVNARDAMPEGGELRLRARNFIADPQYASLVPEARCGPYVLIEVEDEGTGMSREVMDRVFDPFYTTKEQGKGTGLGLSTSLAIVRSHEGFIRVESEPGVGSVFRVYLPVTGLLETAPPSGDGDLPAGKGERILLVEDDESVRDVTRQTLERFGYRVDTASDGAEAVSHYAQHGRDIDLVFTDMMMPVMDGAAMIQVLLRMNPMIRILAASGLSQGDAVKSAIAPGLGHFLSKPYTANRLLRAIRTALGDETPAAESTGGR